MGFSAKVKAELCTVKTEKKCCRKAEAYGMVLFSRFYSKSAIAVQTENENTAKRYYSLLYAATGVSCDIAVPKQNSGLYTVSVKNRDIHKVLDFFSHTGAELVLRLNRANLEYDCCVYAFLRGAFLTCGTVTDPNSEYHLEFLIPRKKLATDFMTLLSECGLSPKLTERKGAAIVYFKESEAIEDIFTMMQATNSSLALMNIKILKDVRNRVNRRTNCETANIDRTMRAAEEQIKAIEKIEARGGIGSLPSELYEIAFLRKNNPYESLSELSKMMKTPLSRSGINHRLKKIIEYAESLKNKV